MVKRVRKTASRKTSTAATSRKKRGMGLAVVGLILNVLILPGLGSLIARKIKAGIWQIVLFIIGAILALYYIPLAIIAFIGWLWGIITGVILIQEARK